MINNEPWSFSRITPACLYGFKKTYIEGDRGINNAFGEYGSLCHDILEAYHHEEIFPFEALELYEERFKKMACDFPPNQFVDLKQSYYERGRLFFEDFERCFMDYELLEAEEERRFQLKQEKFIAYIDFVGRKKANNKIDIIDYKSSSPFDKKKMQEKIRQLYLYAIPVFETYGEYPENLIFLHFRQQKLVKEKFKLEKLEEVKEWALSQAKMLENLKEFPPNLESPFFCDHICSHRESCKFNKKVGEELFV